MKKKGGGSRCLLWHFEIMALLPKAILAEDGGFNLQNLLAGCAFSDSLFMPKKTWVPVENVSEGRPTMWLCPPSMHRASFLKKKESKIT